jgi:two-component system cell cycle response regulator DivK
MSQFRDLKVLYVEDDPASRNVMSIVVETIMGCQHFTLLEDSTDFMARAQAVDPDLYLLDIHLEPHDGLELLSMLREAYGPTKPIVALTASVMSDEVKQLREAGFDGVIGKPLDLNTFPTLIARILDGEEVWEITPQ